MAIIDTSVLVAMFDASHPRHGAARDLADPEPVWHVTGGVLAEFTQIIRRMAVDRGQDGNQAARTALALLENTPGYRPLGGYDAELVSRIYQTQAGLSYVDAWCVGLAYQRAEPLVTFDQDQAKALTRIR